MLCAINSWLSLTRSLTIEWSHGMETHALCHQQLAVSDEEPHDRVVSCGGDPCSVPSNGCKIRSRRLWYSVSLSGRSFYNVTVNVLVSLFTCSSLLINCFEIVETNLLIGKFITNKN